MTHEIRLVLFEKVGVELSDEKTKITEIHDGFNFLGFNIRKYRHKSPKSKFHSVGQLLIKPQKEKVTQFLADCGQLIKDLKGNNLIHLLGQINPKLRGFANYYRFAVSKTTYQKMSHDIWRKVFRWLCKSHPNKSCKWVRKRYSTEYDPTKKTKTFEMNRVKLYLPQFMPIVRFRKIKSGVRVYDNSPQACAYWKERANVNALSSIYSVQVEKLYKRQHGRCPICRQEITGIQIHQSAIHLHHLNPLMKSDDLWLTNLRLLHENCHLELHRILSLDEMSKLATKGLDYCLKDYLSL